MAKLQTFFQRPDRIHTPLHVVTTVFNPIRFRSRVRTYEDFARRIEARDIPLYTAEIAFGERDFTVTQANNPLHLQLRSHHELFLKENALNLMVQRLPLDWKYVAIVDADITFVEDDWADETVHQLQHYPIVQCYSRALGLGPTGEPIENQARLGIAANYQRQGMGLFKENYAYGAKGWGLAWAFRREAWEALGGLIDWSILGGGDWFMGHALWGHVHKAIQRRAYHPRYAEMMYEWQHRAAVGKWEERPILGNVGAVKGLVLHHWHGPAEGRQYKTRPQILVENQFDPDTDIKRDWQGVYQLTDAKPQLRRDIQRYFRDRNEDSIEL